MTPVVRIDSNGRTIAEIIADLREHQDTMQSICVVFQHDGVQYLSASGTWADVCVAAVMMQDHAAKKGNE